MKAVQRGKQFWQGRAREAERLGRWVRGEMAGICDTLKSRNKGQVCRVGQGQLTGERRETLRKRRGGRSERLWNWKGKTQSRCHTDSVIRIQKWTSLPQMTGHIFVFPIWIKSGAEILRFLIPSLHLQPPADVTKIQTVQIQLKT